MSAHSNPGRPAATLWFPFFFAAAFSLMFLLAFAAPKPHGIDLTLAGTDSQTQELSQLLESSVPGGFDIATTTDVREARSGLEHNHVAAAYLVDAEGEGQLLVNSAASPTRAAYLRTVFGDLSPGPSANVQPEVIDVTPKAGGDVSGVGLFFFALPILLVGMITSIVLLQFPAWSLWRKGATVLATGAFASGFSFAAAVLMNVIPFAPMLLVIGLALTQGIGWLTTAVAMLAKRYFMPISMTFVLILNIPASGGTVNSDMMPPFLSAMHGLLPFGHFIDATRSIAYFGGVGAATHVVALVAWAAFGLALLVVAYRRAPGSVVSPGDTGIVKN